MSTSTKRRVVCQDATGQKRTVVIDATTDQGASNAALRKLNTWRVVRVMPDEATLDEPEVRDTPLARVASSSGSLSAAPGKRKRSRGRRARNPDQRRSAQAGTASQVPEPLKEAEGQSVLAGAVVPPGAGPSIGRIVQKGNARDWIDVRAGRSFDTAIGRALRDAL